MENPERTDTQEIAPQLARQDLSLTFHENDIFRRAFIPPVILFLIFPQLASLTLAMLPPRNAFAVMVLTPMVVLGLPLCFFVYTKEKRTKRAIFDDDTVIFLNGDQPIDTQAWSDLVRAHWISPFDFQLCFLNGSTHRFPGEALDGSHFDAIELRRIFLKHKVSIQGGFSSPVWRFVNTCLNTPSLYIVIAVFLAVALLGFAVWVPRVSTPLFPGVYVGFSLGSILKLLIIGFLVRRCWPAPKSIPFEVDESGLQQLDKRVDWEEIVDIDWFGPRHGTLRVHTSTSRPWTIPLAEAEDLEALRSQIMDHPRIKAAWERKLISSHSQVIPLKRWYLTSDLLLFLPLVVFSGSVAFQFAKLFTSTIQPLLFATVVAILIGIALLTWVWVTRRVPTMPKLTFDESTISEEFHKVNNLPYRDILCVNIYLSSGLLTIFFSEDKYVEVAGSDPNVGLILSLLRTKVSPDQIVFI